jgi:hypothetical protein
MCGPKKKNPDFPKLEIGNPDPERVNHAFRALKDPHPGPSRSPEKGPNPPLEFMLWKNDKF